MGLHVDGIAASGLTSMKLHAVIFRACRVCGESNPGWTVCPSCGTPGVHEDQGVVTAWYRNPFRQRLWAARRYLRKRN